MSKTEFELFYEGPILEDGSMDVRDLAPAMLAMGDAMELAGKVLYGDSAKTLVNVRCFKHGSFGVSLEVCQDLGSQILHLFFGDAVNGALNVLETLGLIAVSSKGLFQLLLFAKGKKPKTARKLKNGNVLLVFPNDQSIETSEEATRLFKNLDIRSSLRSALAPIEKDGINSVYSVFKNKKQELVAKKELSYFDQPEESEDVLNEEEGIRVFSIVSLSFKDGNKWRLNDGTGPVFVTIEDATFLKKVDEGKITFAKNDLLKARLHTRQLRTSKGLHNDFTILEVLEHTRGEQQIPLPIGDFQNQ
jgi:hypothetical protein